MTKQTTDTMPEAVAAPEEMQNATELPAVTVDELEGLDVYTGEEAQDSGAWRIKDDSAAEWAVKKIAAERAELERIKALADEQNAQILEKVAAAERRYENGTNFFSSFLAQYFETVPHRKTKTKHSYRLLSGTLTKKIGGVSLKANDEALLQYLKDSGRTDMIQTVEKAKWGEFKKGLEIVDGTVIDKETGEIVEGVEITVKPDTFVVEV